MILGVKIIHARQALCAFVVFSAFAFQHASAEEQRHQDEATAIEATEGKAQVYKIITPEWAPITVPASSDDAKARSYDEYSREINKVLSAFFCTSMGYLDRIERNKIPFILRSALQKIAATKHNSIHQSENDVIKLGDKDSERKTFERLVLKQVDLYLRALKLEGANAQKIRDELDELFLHSSRGLIRQISRTRYGWPVDGFGLKLPTGAENKIENYEAHSIGASGPLNDFIALAKSDDFAVLMSDAESKHITPEACESFAISAFNEIEGAVVTLVDREEEESKETTTKQEGPMQADDSSAQEEPEAEHLEPQNESTPEKANEPKANDPTPQSRDGTLKAESEEDAADKRAETAPKPHVQSAETSIKKKENTPPARMLSIEEVLAEPVFAPEEAHALEIKSRNLLSDTAKRDFIEAESKKQVIKKAEALLRQELPESYGVLFDSLDDFITYPQHKPSIISIDGIDQKSHVRDHRRNDYDNETIEWVTSERAKRGLVEPDYDELMDLGRAWQKKRAERVAKLVEEYEADPEHEWVWKRVAGFIPWKAGEKKVEKPMSHFVDLAEKQLKAEAKEKDEIYLDQLKTNSVIAAATALRRLEFVPEEYKEDELISRLLARLNADRRAKGLNDLFFSDLKHMAEGLTDRIRYGQEIAWDKEAITKAEYNAIVSAQEREREVRITQAEYSDIDFARKKLEELNAERAESGLDPISFEELAKGAETVLKAQTLFKESVDDHDTDIPFDLTPAESRIIDRAMAEIREIKTKQMLADLKSPAVQRIQERDQMRFERLQATRAFDALKTIREDLAVIAEDPAALTAQEQLQDVLGLLPESVHQNFDKPVPQQVTAPDVEVVRGRFFGPSSEHWKAAYQAALEKSKIGALTARFLASKQSQDEGEFQYAQFLEEKAQRKATYEKEVEAYTKVRDILLVFQDASEKAMDIVSTPSPINDDVLFKDYSELEAKLPEDYRKLLEKPRRQHPAEINRKAARLAFMKIWSEEGRSGLLEIIGEDDLNEIEKSLESFPLNAGEQGILQNYLSEQAHADAVEVLKTYTAQKAELDQNYTWAIERFEKQVAMLEQAVSEPEIEMAVALAGTEDASKRFRAELKKRIDAKGIQTPVRPDLSQDWPSPETMAAAAVSESELKASSADKQKLALKAHSDLDAFFEKQRKSFHDFDDNARQFIAIKEELLQEFLPPFPTYLKEINPTGSEDRRVLNSSDTFDLERIQDEFVYGIVDSLGCANEDINITRPERMLHLSYRLARTMQHMGGNRGFSYDLFRNRKMLTEFAYICRKIHPKKQNDSGFDQCMDHINGPFGFFSNIGLLAQQSIPKAKANEWYKDRSAKLADERKISLWFLDNFEQMGPDVQRDPLAQKLYDNVMKLDAWAKEHQGQLPCEAKDSFISDFRPLGIQTPWTPVHFDGAEKITGLDFGEEHFDYDINSTSNFTTTVNGQSTINNKLHQKVWKLYAAKTAVMGDDFRTQACLNKPSNYRRLLFAQAYCMGIGRKDPLCRLNPAMLSMSRFFEKDASGKKNVHERTYAYAEGERLYWDPIGEPKHYLGSSQAHLDIASTKKMAKRLAVFLALPDAESDYDAARFAIHGNEGKSVFYLNGRPQVSFHLDQFTHHRDGSGRRRPPGQTPDSVFTYVSAWKGTVGKAYNDRSKYGWAINNQNNVGFIQTPGGPDRLNLYWTPKTARMSEATLLNKYGGSRFLMNMGAKAPDIALTVISNMKKLPVDEMIAHCGADMVYRHDSEMPSSSQELSRMDPMKPGPQTLSFLRKEFSYLKECKAGNSNDSERACFWKWASLCPQFQYVTGFIQPDHAYGPIIRYGQYPKLEPACSTVFEWLLGVPDEQLSEPPTFQPNVSGKRWYNWYKLN